MSRSGSGWGGSQPGREAGWISAVDASFTLERGEVLGVVGESGSGTTLARMLVRLLTPTEGRIVFHGQDITQPRRRDRRDLCRRIQIDFSLDPRMRVSSVIAEGLYHSKLGARCIEELLDVSLAWTGWPGLPAPTLRGERSRVGIARALRPTLNRSQ